MNKTKVGVLGNGFVGEEISFAFLLFPFLISFEAYCLVANNDVPLASNAALKKFSDLSYCPKSEHG